MPFDKPEIIFVEHFIPNADALLEAILTKTSWDERMQRRLTASYGVPYNYSNLTYPEVAMPDYLRQVGDAIGQQLEFAPNNCLINYYADGSASMGYHADSIAELVPATGVAIVSLGATRALQFRRTQARDVKWACPLPHGSLLYMPAEIQLEWQHGILKQEGIGPRVSLTFRNLRP